MKIGKISKFGAMAMAALGGIAVMPGTARALSCATNSFVAPRAGDTGVPTDTLIWGYAQSFARLRGPSGELVATDERQLPIAIGSGMAGTLAVQVPVEPLEPNATYTIEAGYGGDPASLQRIVFSTAAAPASGAPALPRLLSSEPYAAAGFSGGINRGVELSFEADGILIGDAGQLGDLSTIDALFQQGETIFNTRRGDELPAIQWASFKERVWAGILDCGVWPLGAGDSASGRFGVLDLAGNFSGWTPVALELPSPAEAELAVADEQEALQNLNVQQGRPSACSIGAPGAAASDTGGQGRAGLLALALGIVVTGARRARRGRG